MHNVDYARSCRLRKMLQITSCIPGVPYYNPPQPRCSCWPRDLRSGEGSCWSRTLGRPYVCAASRKWLRPDRPRASGQLLWEASRGLQGDGERVFQGGQIHSRWLGLWALKSKKKINSSAACTSVKVNPTIICQFQARKRWASQLFSV